MHLPGFEPGTSRVWGERDNQLHHKCQSNIPPHAILNTRTNEFSIKSNHIFMIMN